MRSRYRKRMELKLDPLRLIFFPLSVVWMECMLKWWTLGSPFGQGFLPTLLFSAALGLLLALLSSLGERKVNRIVSIAALAVLTVWFMINSVYHTIFKSFLALDSMTMAGDALSNYWRETLSGIGNSIPVLLALLVPLILLLVLVRLEGGRRSAGEVLDTCPHSAKLMFLALAIAAHLLGLLCVNLSSGGVMSARAIYHGDVVPELSVSHFGLMTTLRLDITNRLFPDTASPESLPEPEPEQSVTPETPEEIPEADPEPQPIVYEDNVLNIDFAALAQSTEDKALKAIDEWVASRTPTKQNEYTGMFKGKNLIFITAEAFWKYAVSEEFTPTLYKLANEGFVFENFYNPLWWKSTIDGEYVHCTGLIPSNQVFSFRTSGSNSMPFCMGNMLRAEGYTTKAYHNNTYTYYDRDVSHPNMGYDYYGLGNGLEVKKTWPQSDLEMMEKTIPQALEAGTPFHNYYMTVSGHMNYNFLGNMMSYKHRDAVAHLEMSEEARAYIACNMELDWAMEYVLEQLEAAGQLENTVICISGDHYPYGMDPATWDELKGGPMDTDFEIFHSTLILWSGDMEEPVHIEKPCCSMDVLPTLLNLFGLEYDSRLLAGQDILSDSPGLVALSNRSFITEEGRYNSTTDEWIPNEGSTVGEDYPGTIYKQVSGLFKHSGNILLNDYYGSLEDRVGSLFTPKEAPEAPEQGYAEVKYTIEDRGRIEQLSALFLGDPETVERNSSNDYDMIDWLTNWTNAYVVYYGTEYAPPGEGPAWYARAIDAGSWYFIRIPDHLVDAVLEICETP